MAKKKIGSATVTDGVARGCFTLPEQLGKGVYELIGEYKGSNIYKPSYDTKKLIVGLKADFKDLQSYYKISDIDRKLTVTGRLIGYNESGLEQSLTNQKIGLKIGTKDNPLGKGVLELNKEALTLKTVNGSKTVTTDRNGYFEFECYVPLVYDEWEYRIYVGYGGNYDYVACVSEKPLYIGDAPTFTTIKVYPDTHLHPQGGFLLESAVYCYRDIDNNGNPVDGAERITHGNLIFKESNTGKDGSFTNMILDGDTKMKPQALSINNGYVRHRVMFNRDEEDTFQRYIYAQYSGSSSGFGYKPSRSSDWGRQLLFLQVDSDGVMLQPLNIQFPCATNPNDVIFIPYHENRPCQITIKNGTNNVPNGVLTTRIDDD